MIETCLKALEKEGVTVETVAVVMVCAYNEIPRSGQARCELIVLKKGDTGFHFWSTRYETPTPPEPKLDAVSLSLLTEPSPYLVKVDGQNHLLDCKFFDSFAIFSKFFDFVFNEQVQGRPTVPCLIMTLEAFEALEKGEHPAKSEPKPKTSKRNPEPPTTE